MFRRSKNGRAPWPSMVRLAWWLPLMCALTTEEALADALSFHWMPRLLDAILGWAGVASTLAIAVFLEFRLAAKQRRYRRGLTAVPPVLATPELPDEVQAALADEVAGLRQRQERIFDMLEAICTEAEIQVPCREPRLRVVPEGVA